MGSCIVYRGHGVAIPLGKSATVRDLLLAASASPKPITFDPVDGQPVQLFCLLVGPVSAAAAHVKALSRITRLACQAPFRERPLSARDAEEFHQTLCDAERK